MTNWKFKDPKNVAVYTTKSVVVEFNPILRVFHDKDDGAWQFHYDENPKEEDIMIVALSEIIEIDNTINKLANLPLGWKAQRESLESKWELFENP